MAQQFTSLIKFRRGLKEQRQRTSFQEGEPIYETDTRRLFIGVGDNNEANIGPESVGGIVTSNLTFVGPANTDPTIETEPRSYTGDLMYANGKIWRLGTESWEDISPKVDGTTISYNVANELTVLPGAFTITGGQGINVSNDNVISLRNSVSNVLQIVNNELTLPEGSITAQYFADETFSPTYFNRLGSIIQVNLNPNYFSTDGNIKIANVPAGEKNDTTTTDGSTVIGTVNAIITSRLGQSAQGITINETQDLILDPTISVTNEDTSTIIGVKPGIGDILAGNTPNSPYNGTISENITQWTGEARTEVALYEEDNLTAPNPMVVFSGGMILMDLGASKTGKFYKKYAIPVFELPDEPLIYHIQNTAPYTLVGFNLGGLRIFNITEGETTENQITGFTHNSTNNSDILTLANAITVPEGGSVIARNYLKSINLEPLLANNPIITRVINNGTEETPNITVYVANISENKADITISYTLYSAPTQTSQITDFNVGTTVNYEVPLTIVSFPGTTPTWTDLDSITVTYNGKSTTYNLND